MVARKIFNIILKEVGPLLIALVSVAIVYPYIWIWKIPISILTVGAVYTLLKPFYDYRKRPWKMRWIRLGLWLLNVIYQLWNIIKYLFITIGYIIDLLGNVLLGELIEDLTTSEEKTLFGNGGVTISAALGDLLRRGKLNKFGLWLCWLLSSLDPIHENHCLSAIRLYIYKKSQAK